jgi:hypothetical protein
MGILIDWSDIGGQQSVDFVIWGTNMDYEAGDRFPNNASASYNLIGNDRQVNFSEALLGNFETSDPLATNNEFTTTTTKPLDGNQITTADPITTEDPTNSSGSPPFLFVFILVGILLGLFVFRDRLFGQKDNYNDQDMPYKPIKRQERSPPRTPLSYDPRLGQRGRTPEVQMKYIPELGREIRMCCYQTARLNEAYCWCGRAIDEDVRQLFLD